MTAVITSIELKSPFKFFLLSFLALRIVRQIKTTPYLAYRSTGFWTKHYTMSLWNNMDDMKAFAKSGAHLEAMKRSALLAKEIRTVLVQVDAIPKWSDAKSMLLKEGRVLNF